MRHLEQDPSRFARRERPVPVQPHGEVFTIQQRHHEIHDPVPLIDAVNGDDVRMAQLCGGFGLAQEAGPDLRPEGELRRKDLDGDMTLEPAVLRFVNDTHTAPPDLAVEFVSRREDALDVCSKVWVCRLTDWLGHAGVLAGYDDGAVE